MKFIISGWGDDLIEVEGDIDKEYEIPWQGEIETALILHDTVTKSSLYVQCKFNDSWRFIYDDVPQEFSILNHYDDKTGDQCLDIETDNPIIIGQVL